MCLRKQKEYRRVARPVSYTSHSPSCGLPGPPHWSAAARLTSRDPPCGSIIRVSVSSTGAQLQQVL